MRLGLIADIHADIRALRSALRHLDDLGIGTILCAGDLVGYGSHADEVIALLRDRAIPCIRGNHDRWAIERGKVIGPRGWKPAAFRAETWDYLAALPACLRVTRGGRTLAVYHGSPASDIEFVSPYKPKPHSVDQFWDEDDASLLVLGHTHIFDIDRGPRGTVLNPGSLLGVPGVQTSYSFAVVKLDDLATVFYDVRTGREIHRDPIFLEVEPDDSRL